MRRPPPRVGIMCLLVHTYMPATLRDLRDCTAGHARGIGSSKFMLPGQARLLRQAARRAGNPPRRPLGPLSSRGTWKRALRASPGQGEPGPPGRRENRLWILSCVFVHRRRTGAAGLAGERREGRTIVAAWENAPGGKRRIGLPQVRGNGRVLGMAPGRRLSRA